ncbi:triose-phosphate isomerase [Syntrophotalea acetylenivorans]|uniref:Triosephosphate isomerase n=1 Tax=Syntrophotalea acetylenivorans TaxID=1842532 RepID=A0A1L3GMC3_9BACT|nr:triose-phosphate isomerase [Syntrophotalea acetylenivorans]APG26828.1 triose-phosphate isomerase [Syntrophotalea acetylenivorans]
MRTPIIAGNWKLNKTVDEALGLAKALKEQLNDLKNVEIIVAPPFTALAPLAEALKDSPILLAGQNCYPAEGAYTGEISPTLLRDVGCRAVIIGHSERRHLFAETDEFINQKIKAALAAGLRVIFCIGETLTERNENRTFEVLESQTRNGLSGLDSASMNRLTVAYEPVWAIGTGQTASNEQAQEAHHFIRELLGNLFDSSVAENTRILYGGSVKPENIDGLICQADIDGALVGGASLKAGDFIRIARFKQS